MIDLSYDVGNRVRSALDPASFARSETDLETLAANQGTPRAGVPLDRPMWANDQPPHCILCHMWQTASPKAKVAVILAGAVIVTGAIAHGLRKAPNMSNKPSNIHEKVYPGAVGGAVTAAAEAAAI